MAQNFTQKLEARKQLIMLRAAAIFGLNESEVAPLLAPVNRCLRLNPLSAATNDTLQTLLQNDLKTATTTQLPQDCYSLSDPQSPQAEAALQAVLASGAAYLQNPSSFIPVIALDPQPNEIVLDLCASPGGKASYIAALTRNQAVLWLNDTSFDRLQRLKRVCNLLQVTVASYTLVHGESASKKLPLATFDKILLDAPCSGEDIRLLNIKELGSWSPAKVKRLAELQKKLLKEAWKLLKPGGTIVYSTCSQAPEENEAVISWFLSKHEDAATEAISPSRTVLSAWNGTVYQPGVTNAVRIAPDENYISFFACKITKER